MVHSVMFPWYSHHINTTINIPHIIYIYMGGVGWEHGTRNHIYTPSYSISTKLEYNWNIWHIQLCPHIYIYIYIYCWCTGWSKPKRLFSRMASQASLVLGLEPRRWREGCFTCSSLVNWYIGTQWWIFTAPPNIFDQGCHILYIAAVILLQQPLSTCSMTTLSVGWIWLPGLQFFWHIYQA